MSILCGVNVKRTKQALQIHILTTNFHLFSTISIVYTVDYGVFLICKLNAIIAECNIHFTIKNYVLVLSQHVRCSCEVQLFASIIRKFAWIKENAWYTDIHTLARAHTHGRTIEYNELQR